MKINKRKYKKRGDGEMVRNHSGFKFFCIAFFFLLLPTVAHSKPITFEFTGTVTTVYAAASSLPPLSTVKVGDTITGNYVFESTTPGTPDIFFHLNHLMTYWNALNQFEILFGKSKFSLIASSIGSISVQNNDQTGTLYRNDNYKVNTGGNLEYDSHRILAEIILSDGNENAGQGTNPDGLPGSSSALPLYPPDLTLFDRTTRIDISASGLGLVLRVDLVTLTRPPNLLPGANAGQDQVVHSEVTLDGSLSVDNDGAVVSYDWALKNLNPTGSPRNASGVNPTVTDLVQGFYSVTLTVTDDEGGTNKDTMLLAAYGPAYTPAEYDQMVADKDAVIDSMYTQTQVDQVVADAVAVKDIIITDLTDENDQLETLRSYYLYGDFNADGDVDADDLFRFAGNYGLADIDIYDDFDEDGFSEYDGDCDDVNINIHPDADELCSDEVDNNCNGLVNEQPCI